ncbi:ras-related protein Rab-44 isoform X2 [Erythrolamprus reginae]|uniref:ras-related protein Rab-44 isoform X2 n=1 Tax=Erythrolamprus reginae TaxID=121349 RepID=UPI00396D0558
MLNKSEIWKIWVQFWEAEPHLLGNLKEFLAKMTHLIKEAKHEKEKIQLLLKIQISEHNKKVQKLYEEMEQQIEREKQKLQNESQARSQLHCMEMQQELGVREQEIQHCLIDQKELETQLLSLREKQLVTSIQTQQLQQTKSSLENQLQQTLHQLQQTKRGLAVMKDRISQLHNEGRDTEMEGDTSKDPYSAQDPVNLDEMIFHPEEVNMEYILKEDKMDSSIQQTSDDVTSMTEADVESGRRVISTEEDPFIEPFVDEDQYFPQEPSDTNSLFNELNEAIATLNKMSGSHYQERIDDFGFQQEPLDHESSQQNIMPLFPTKECSTNKTVRNRTSEVAISEAGGYFREVPLCVQGRDLEMKRAIFSKIRKEAKTTEPTLRERFASVTQPFVYSHLTIQVSDYKKSPIESGIQFLEGETQAEHKKKVLEHNDTIQVPQLSTDEGVANQSAKMKIPERKVSQTQHPLLKKMPSENFMPKVALPKLPAEHNPSSQLQNMFRPGMDTEFAERLKLYSSEGRKERWIGPSEYKKNQAISAEFKEETRVRTEVCDCQMIKETSKDMAILYSHPDHFYNVLFVGDTNVGKTSFLNKFQNDSFAAKVTATIGMDYRIKNLILDSKCFALRLWDTAGQERYHSVTKQFFRKADGVVLMYDITSEYSFKDVRYWLNCVQEGAGAGVVVLLLGNKTDCSAERRVSVENGTYLAKVYGLPFYECSAASGYNITESIVQLVRLMKIQEDQLKKKALDLPVELKNKRSCCL